MVLKTRWLSLAAILDATGLVDRKKVVWGLLIVGAVAATGWCITASRRQAADEIATRWATSGMIMQRTAPWRIEQINRWPSTLSPEEVCWLPRFPAIRSLNLDGVGVTDADLSHFVKLPRLEALLLGNTRITDQGLPTVAEMSSLKWVGLEHTTVTKGAVLQLMRRRPDLEIEVHQASLYGLGHLSPLPGAEVDEDLELITLDLHASAVVDDDLRPLAQCGRLRMLNLSETAIGDEGFVHLASLRNLEELWLRRTEVTDRSLAAIGQMQNLRALSLAETVVSDAGVAHLQNLHRLEVLHLGSTQVSDAGLKALQTITSLKEIYVTNSLVTGEGAAAFTETLPGISVIVDPGAADRAQEIESQVLG